jgi:hypothetical protein
MLGIFALKRYGEGMQLRRHQPCDNGRIAFHECPSRRFIPSLKDGNAECLVSWLKSAARQDQFIRFDGVFESS